MANNQLKEEIILSTGQFDKNINSVIRKVEDLRQKGSKVGDGFNTSMGSLISTVGKFSGALGAITSGVQLADWFKNSVQEGLKLAEQGEGIRIAFERLNSGELLDNLRKETHNTVTDLELMKQAVKFNDFKLPLDQMGTFLAFAQQKAKDTGVSIDYMVDSIVTGLGRKSLPILDNLGLSAAEIKEKMKEGGDMTLAVAEIIKEQMQNAGGYVETAADRAKQKEVEIQNELEKLGNTFQPLQETASNFWHSIEIGALRVINNLRPLINQFTELGRIMNQYLKLGGESKVDKMVSYLGDGKSSKAFNTYKKQLKEFDKAIDKSKRKIAALGFGKNSKDAITQGLIAREKERLEAVKKMRAEYVKEAQKLRNASQASNTSSTTNSGNTTTTTKGSKTNYPVGSIGYYEELISSLQKEIKIETDTSELLRLQNDLKEAVRLKNRLEDVGFTKRQEEVKNNTQLSGLGSLFDDKKIKEQIENFKPIITEQIKNFKPAIKLISEQFSDVVDKIGTILDAYDMGVIGADKAKELIDGINEQLLALGLKPVEVPIEIDKSLQKVNAMKDAFASLESVMSSMGQIFEEPLLDAAGIIAQAVATYILGWTKATEQANALGPIGWAAFGLSTAAQMFAIVAQIKSAGAFANGGIIGGSSYAGDNLYARVNSGEMILNGSQQANLFNMLNGGSSSVGASNVNFVIRGSELHGVLKNYNGKMSKIR